jgi:adenylate cyclase
MRFHFSGQVLDVALRELRRDGARVMLEPRVFDLLAHLVRNRDRVVSKDDLIEHVWGGRIVSDAAIDTGIKAARQAVGDNGAAQSVIRTIPRKGVRFVADVEEQRAIVPAAHPDETEPLPPQSSLTPPGKPSIAVLPFTNMSSDPEQEFFSDGIAEDIITALSRYPSLFVIARNSSFIYKGRTVDVIAVGRDLGVRYVLEGSVRKAGDRVRVTGQLIDAETGNHLWAERYDRGIADIFAVQDEITTAVTIAIAPAINHAELHRAMRKFPGNLDAWAAYQRGLWHLAKSTADETILAEGFFRQAIELDPNFGGGYRGLAWTHIVGGTLFQLYTEALRSAEAFARRAVALDDADAEAHVCLSGALLQGYGDYRGARTEADRALTISPNLAAAHGELGRTLIFAGSPREGLAAVEMSIRLDPRDPLMAMRLNHLAVGYYFCRDYISTAEAATRAIRAYPDHPQPYRWLAAALGQAGCAAEATEALAKAIAISPVSFDLFVRRRVPWHRPEDYAHMLDGLRKAGWEG